MALLSEMRWGWHDTFTRWLRWSWCYDMCTSLQAMTRLSIQLSHRPLISSGTRIRPVKQFTRLTSCHFAWRVGDPHVQTHHTRAYLLLPELPDEPELEEYLAPLGDV